MSDRDYKIFYDLFFKSVGALISANNTGLNALKRLGIVNLRDLIFYKPCSYRQIIIDPDLQKIKHGELIETTITLEDILRPISPRSPIKFIGSNNTGSIILVFFNKIHPFIYKKLRMGNKINISGEVEFYDNHIQITHPEFIFNKKYSTTILPIYPLTYGLTNKQLYSYIVDAINFLDQHIQNNNYFTDLMTQIKNLHYLGSQTHNDLKINKHIDAIKILAFQELLSNQALLAKLKQEENKKHGRSFKPNNALQTEILSKLGFELTQDQAEAIADINADQSSNFQMMRLLQGDVGSGKTLVALLTIINVISNGAQTAFMAPTDLLSIQHYHFFCQALENTNINISLLTGKTTAKQKKQVKADLINGKINILIGTHALFQENVEFQDLGYIIIDEQHKFGVQQRLELIRKASNPDVLIMTATPIPRSLSLTMFGDMEISKIKNKPKNRTEIITTIISTDKKHEVINSLDKKLQNNEKIYWVCSLIDENDKIIEKPLINCKTTSMANCQERFAELENIYPGQIALLHGKLKGNIKDQIMQEFKNMNKNILVATTVIEVGIDVSNATLIIIENAEQFGLAQAHQLRGRVGRGLKQSHCILMYNPKRLSKIAKKRLNIMRKSNDGFYIAEQDLLLRGSGEIMGTKQSGELVFFFANLAEDLELLLKANKLAFKLKFDNLTHLKIKLFCKK